MTGGMLQRFFAGGLVECGSQAGVLLQSIPREGLLGNVVCGHQKPIDAILDHATAFGGGDYWQSGGHGFHHGSGGPFTGAGEEEKVELLEPVFHFMAGYGASQGQVAGGGAKC